MKISYSPSDVPNPLEVLRKAGYSPFTDPKTGSESFVLKLTSGFYPRFHLYLEQEGGNLVFSLHIDQKKPSYKGTRAHGGEYDGPTVEREMKRIADWVFSTYGIAPAKIFPQTPRTPLKNPEPPSKTPPNKMFGGIF